MIEVELPDGRVLPVDTTDPMKASQAAKLFLQKESKLAPVEAPKFSPDQEALIAERMKAYDMGGKGGIRAGADAGARAGTLGLANVAEGLMDRVEALVRKGGYAENLDALNEADRRYRDKLRSDNPVASLAGDIAGGFSIGGTLSGMAGGAGAVRGATPAAGSGTALDTVGGAIKSFMTPSTGGIGSQVGKGIAQGAATSGIYAATEGDNIGNAALAGGVVGGALPAAMAAARGVYAVGDNLISPMLRPKEFAAKKWVQAAEGAPGGAQGALNRAQANDALPIDYAPEQARVLARAAMDVPNPGTGRTTTMMNTRQMQQSDRITNKVAKAFGDPDLYQDKFDDAIDTLRTNGDANYGAARAAKRPVDVGPVLDKIDETIAPGVSKIANPASTIADDSTSAVLARVRSKLASKKDRLFDLEDLHLVKEDIDDAIAKAKRAGSGTLARKLMAVKTELLGAMEKDNPLYKAARTQFSSDAAVRDAFEEGLGYFTTKGATMSARDVAQMSVAEVKAFKFGVSRAIADLVDRGADGADAVKAVIGSPAKRQALDALFASAKERREFYTAMLVEARKYRTRAELTGNSKTNRYRQASEEGGVSADVAKDLLTGGLTGAAKALVTRGLARAKGMSPEVANEYLKLATSKNPQAMAQTQALLQQAQGRKVRFEELRRALMQNVPAVTGATMAPEL
jgi:hypothetical protein